MNQEGEVVKEKQEEEQILCRVAGLSTDLEVSEGPLKTPSLHN